MGIEFGPAQPPEYLKKAQETGYKDLSTLELDRRQMKFLKEVCDQWAKKEKNKNLSFEFWDSDEEPWDDDLRRARLIEMDNKDRHDPKNPPPKFREVAKRFRQIRKDRGWTVKQFAEALHSPATSDPYIGHEFKYTEKQIHALEYGTVKIDKKIADLVFEKFQVSQEWLLLNKGVPHTKTNVLTGPRINYIEQKGDALEIVFNNLQKTVNNNAGLGLMEELEKNNDPSVYRSDDGGISMSGSANAKLRLDLNEAQQKIESLENQVQLMNRLIITLEEKVAHIEKNYQTEEMVSDIVEGHLAPEPLDIERDPEGNPL